GVLSVGGADLPAGPAPVGGGGIPVPAGAAATGDVPLQACADPGRRVSVVAAQHPPAVSPAYCPGVSGTVPRDSRNAPRTAGASLYGSRSQSAGRGVLAAGRSAGPR